MTTFANQNQYQVEIIFLELDWTKDDVYFTTLNWNDVCYEIFLEEIGTDTVRSEAYKLVVMIAWYQAWIRFMSTW